MKHKFARNGRQKAIGLLDQIFSESDNLAKLKEALQVEFDKDPVQFFRDFAVALAPREMETLDEGLWAKLTPAQAVELMDKKTVGNIKLQGNEDANNTET